MLYTDIFYIHETFDGQEKRIVIVVKFSYKYNSFYSFAVYSGAELFISNLMIRVLFHDESYHNNSEKY